MSLCFNLLIVLSATRFIVCNNVNGVNLNLSRPTNNGSDFNYDDYGDRFLPPDDIMAIYYRSSLNASLDSSPSAANATPSVSLNTSPHTSRSVSPNSSPSASPSFLVAVIIMKIIYSIQNSL